MFTLIFNYGCEGEKGNKTASSQIDSEQVERSGDAASNLSLRILNSYYEVKNALVASDINMAKKKAGELAKLLKEDNDTVDMIILSEAIAGAQGLPDQRMEFDKLSENMYTLAKASKFHPEVIYRLYCPMAFDNKGAYWLSDQKEIMNPYFGDSMLRCGRLVETISR